MTRAPGVLIQRDDSVLVMIDFQPKLMLGCTTNDAQVLLRNAIGLAAVGATFGLPIVTTGGRPDDPYLPQVIEAAGPTRVHVDRRSIDAWHTPEFVTAIERTGRRTLVIAGITTDLCVLLPALSAREAGYDVQVIADASACFTRQIEEISLMRLVQAGVTVSTWATFAAELHRSKDWPQDVGPKLMGVFAEHHAGMGLIAAMSGQAK